MVLVKAKRDELLGPISAVSGIIERRHTLPILSNVLIERGTGTLSFLATDIEIQITSRGVVESAGEAHSVTVGARKLVDILRALPDGAEVTLQRQDKRLLVKAGKSRFALQTLPAEDFPRLAKPGGDTARFALSQKALRRPGLVHTPWRSRTSAIPEWVADGRRGQDPEADRHGRSSPGLCRDGALENCPPEVIVPRKTVIELGKLLADSDDEVKVEISRPRLHSHSATSKLVSSSSTENFLITHGSFRGAQEQTYNRARGVAPV
jgi:DNA polymerase-3 subunit beta